MNNKAYMIFVWCLLLLACGSFSYKHYVVQPMPGEELRGVLAAKDQSEDLPLSRCQPDDIQKGKCVVLFVEEWERLRVDYDALKMKLEECESDKP